MQIASFTPTALTDNPALTDYPATAFPAGHTSTGHQAIRELYEGMLSARSNFPPGDQRRAIRNGDLALTSTHVAGQITAEVARRQRDGSWLWLIDQPDVLS